MIGCHSVLRTWMRFDGLVVGLAIGINVCKMWEDVGPIGIIESVDGFCVHHVDIVLFCLTYCLLIFF